MICITPKNYKNILIHKFENSFTYIYIHYFYFYLYILKTFMKISNFLTDI